MEINDDLAHFFGHHSFISVAAASASLVPDVAYAVACYVDNHPLRLRIALDSVQAESVLALVQQSGRIAVVFSETISHRTLQVKGNDVKISPVPHSDWDDIARRSHEQLALFEPVGFGGAFGRTYNHYDAEHLVYLHFTVSELYDQTPGPNAGKTVQEAQ